MFVNLQYEQQQNGRLHKKSLTEPHNSTAGQDPENHFLPESAPNTREPADLIGLMSPLPV